MSLSSKDFDRLHEFYKESLEQFGNSDARSVQWISDFNQQKRFEVLAQICDISRKSVLDVGCGLGDLYPFLQNHFPSFTYTGIDIVPELVLAAEKKFPDAHFINKDIEDLANKDSYDVVLASGTLSFKVEDNWRHYQEVIKKMYSLARVAVGFNMLDATEHVDDDVYAAYSSAEVADFCKTLCPKVEIITDYLPQDFTVYMYR